jgi:hypothetical protein
MKSMLRAWCRSRKEGWVFPSSRSKVFGQVLENASLGKRTGNGKWLERLGIDEDFARDVEEAVAAHLMPYFTHVDSCDDCNEV